MEEEAGEPVAHGEVVLRRSQQGRRFLPVVGHVAQVFRDDGVAGRMPGDVIGNQLIEPGPVDDLAPSVFRGEEAIDDGIVQLRTRVMRGLEYDGIDPVLAHLVDAPLEPHPHVFPGVLEQRVVVERVPELVVVGGPAPVLVGAAVHHDGRPLGHGVTDGLGELAGKRLLAEAADDDGDFAGFRHCEVPSGVLVFGEGEVDLR